MGIDFETLALAKKYTDKKQFEASGADLGVASAEVGQTIIVKAVDENGKPTAWEAADMDATDEYVVLLQKTFDAAVANTDEWGGESHLYSNRHFWTTDIDGNDVEADGIYVRIHVPAQTGDEIISSGEMKIAVGQGEPSNWMAWIGHYQKQPYVGWAEFVDSNGAELWCGYDIDLRTQTYKSQRKSGQTAFGNFQNNCESVASSFHAAVAANNWTFLSGIEVILVAGSLPAGTEILIYARKRNPAKVAALPRWEDSV